MKYEDKRDILEAIYAVHEDLAKKIQFNTKMIHESHDVMERTLDSSLAQFTEEVEKVLEVKDSKTIV